MLSYHTFFAQYTGDTPEDVVQAIYADAKAGTGMSFNEWWEYQDDLWGAKYGKKIPKLDEPDAARKLLDVLVDVGAVETTPKLELKKFTFVKGQT